jgi:MFS family permease
MTPIGGKLGDIFGRQATVIVSGAACILFGIGIAFATTLPVLLICRIGLGIAQGAFMAAPYIIVGVINEKKDVPKAMGLLSTALAIGGFGGSIVAGILTDLGALKLAILFPAVPLAIGVVFIGFFYPNDRNANGKVRIDTIGIILLIIALCGILLPLNFASALGWGNPVILLGFAVGIVFTIIFIRTEQKAEQPIIPVRLFEEKKYLAFVIISFICYIYRGAMDVYAPLGAINVMGTSAATAGSLQFPRTIITIFLPVLAGTWVAKKKANMWKAMAFATAFSAIPMLAMGFTTQSVSFVGVYYVALAVTGIAESFRGVSVTPAAQMCLRPEDIGVGTSLVNFANSLASSMAAALYGTIYGGFTAADATDVTLIQKGVNGVFLAAGAMTLVGVVLVLFWVRPMVERR